MCEEDIIYFDSHLADYSTKILHVQDFHMSMHAQFDIGNAANPIKSLANKSFFKFMLQSV